MKRVLSCMLITVLLVLGFCKTNVYAEPTCNNLKFYGEIVQINNLYEGRSVQSSDFSINGYFTDGNDQELDYNDIATLLQFDTNTQKLKFYAFYKKNINMWYLDYIDVNLVPFDSTVNYEDFTIKQVKFHDIDELESVKLSIRTHLWQQIAKINFYNNQGEKLDIDYDNTFVDTTSFQMIAGTYIIPYTVNFRSKNLIASNQYNSVTGTFEVLVVSIPTEQPEPTPIPTEKIVPEPEEVSLTAEEIYLDIGTSYDINLNNRVKDSTYEWTVDNQEVVDINSTNGLVIAKNRGTAKVYCTVTKPDDTVVVLEANVYVDMHNLFDNNEIQLTETSLDLELGEDFDVDVENLYVESKCSWKTSNRDIIRVTSKTGKITTRDIGEAYVTCTITNGTEIIVLKCNVSVTEPEPEEITE